VASRQDLLVVARRRDTGTKGLAGAGEAAVVEIGSGGEVDAGRLQYRFRIPGALSAQPDGGDSDARIAGRGAAPLGRLLLRLEGTGGSGGRGRPAHELQEIAPALLAFGHGTSSGQRPKVTTASPLDRDPKK